MRVDRFLHCIRLAKSRSIAQSLVEQGTTRIDGRRVLKSSDQVRPGNVISLPIGGRARVIRVLALPMRRGPASEARTFYEEIDARADAT